MRARYRLSPVSFRILRARRVRRTPDRVSFIVTKRDRVYAPVTLSRFRTVSYEIEQYRISLGQTLHCVKPLDPAPFEAGVHFGPTGDNGAHACSSDSEDSEDSHWQPSSE